MFDVVDFFRITFVNEMIEFSQSSNCFIDKIHEIDIIYSIAFKYEEFTFVSKANSIDFTIVCETFSIHITIFTVAKRIKMITSRITTIKREITTIAKRSTNFCD
jgi:hypothetical protein